MALIRPDNVNPEGTVDLKLIQSPADFENAPALQITVQDAEATEAWLQNNYWSLRWRETDVLYQAVALDTLVRTKDGFKPVRDVHPGDEVFGKDGCLHKVVGESEVFQDHSCYELEFSTGEKIIADAGHLWETTACQQTLGFGRGKNPNSRKKGMAAENWKNGAYTAVRNTEELFTTRFYNSGKHNHKIAVAPALECSEQKLLVDPYTLGVWLGDGDSDAPRITSMDEGIIQGVEFAEGQPSKKQEKGKSKASRFAFTNYASKEDSLQARLKNLGVLDNKHIPAEYLNGSREQRLSLLQGLLDTDCSCSVSGNVTFRNTSLGLARGVKELACSLGWRATLCCYEYERYTDGRIYSVHFTPVYEVPVFKLERKAERQHTKVRKTSRGYRTIVNIRPVDSVPVKCISVEGEFFLITDGLIVTHNSPPGISMWEGTTVPKANVNRFVVAETVNAIHPQVMNGLFYESPAFVLRPQPNLTQNATRSITALIAEQLNEMDVRQEVDWGIFSAMLFGTGIWKYGYKHYTTQETKFIRQTDPVKVPSTIPGEPPVEIDTPESDEFVKEIRDVPHHLPTFENKDIRFVLVDPGCKVPNIKKAKFVIDRIYVTYRDLMQMKDEVYFVVDETTKKKVEKKRYDLPSEEEIKSWFEKPIESPPQPASGQFTTGGTTYVHHAKPQFQSTTADPLDEPLEVLERWDNDKVITVLNRVKCIRNEPNEFSCIPFLSVNWWNIPDAFWGLGLGRVIGVEQRVQAGIINACLDLASLIVNPMFVASRGAQIQEQQVRQRIGGIIKVDGKPSEAFQMLESPKIPAELIQQLSLSEGRVERTSGANEQITMGASTGKQGMGRSGTGAAAVIQATMNRIGGFAEMFVRQVYEPLLYAIHDMNREKTPLGYIRKLLGGKLGAGFTFSADDFLNSPAEFEVLAGSHLAAKAQMAQSLFMMMQMFENAPLMAQLSEISQKKINIEELFHMIHDISGWKNYYDIVQDMTPEEKQRQAQQANSPAQQIQGKMTLQNQKFSQDQQIIDQETEARIARDVLRQATEKAAEPELLTGTAAATQGFGAAQNETA